MPSIGEPFSVCLSHATGQLFGSPAVEGANMCQPCWNLIQAAMALYHSEQQVRCIQMLSCHPINPYQSIPIIYVQHIARHDGAPRLSPKVAVEVGCFEHVMRKKGHPCRHQDPKWDRIATLEV